MRYYIFVLVAFVCSCVSTNKQDQEVILEVMEKGKPLRTLRILNNDTIEELTYDEKGNVYSKRTNQDGKSEYWIYDYYEDGKLKGAFEKLFLTDLSEWTTCDFIYFDKKGDTIWSNSILIDLSLEAVYPDSIVFDLDSRTSMEGKAGVFFEVFNKETGEFDESKRQIKFVYSPQSKVSYTHSLEKNEGIRAHVRFVHRIQSSEDIPYITHFSIFEDIEDSLRVKD